MAEPKGQFRDERLDILAGTRGDDSKRAVRLSEIPDLVASTAAGMIQKALKLAANAFTYAAPGLVPAPGGSGSTRFLREDQSWVNPFPNGQLRAFVDFNAIGTVAIRASSNVSSITDNGTGDYTINFTTPISDANYAVALSYSNEFNVQHGVGFIVSKTASALRIQFYSAANSSNTVDKSIVTVGIFR